MYTAKHTANDEFFPAERAGVLRKSIHTQVHHPKQASATSSHPTSNPTSCLSMSSIEKLSLDSASA
eukprot:CAMPEP_0181235946 /NCGR_PEP_ID=MMETSP1096-20121128/37880_1 /TAXON_ID=156174 ORGANISM="Chrysochromulina ericina, Strain CCMP281" /NCGR_SAMPLE_ID=MMETSP1096 /ASSEMBLY_ACC=CAM_ASM_000453 /LENGTH=65 /DNA_ID=CAMNT_0023331027 /DNA_START=35 /DNA_END=229 /DNA_ORIENTATION=+